MHLFLILWTQSNLPKGVTMLGVIYNTDKTSISHLSGDVTGYPHYVGIANMDEKERGKPSNWAFRMIALLPPDVKFVGVDKHIQGPLAARVYHYCETIVMAPFKKHCLEPKEMTDPHGNLRRVCTPLASIAVDTPEAKLIAGVSNRSSSVTTATWHHFGDRERFPPRQTVDVLAAMKAIARKHDPWTDLDAYIRQCKNQGLSGTDRLAMGDYPEPATGSIVSVGDALAHDLLHYELKFIKDHCVEWMRKIIGDKAFAHRYSLLRPRIGQRYFPTGITNIKQMTGREHRAIMRSLICAIAGAVSKPVMRCMRALWDFFYAAWQPRSSSTDWERMELALDEFHLY